MVNLRVSSLQTWKVIATLAISSLVSASAHAIQVIGPQLSASGGSVQAGSTSFSETNSSGLVNVAGSWSTVASGGSLSTGYDYKGNSATYGPGSYQISDNLSMILSSSPAFSTTGSYSFSTDMLASPGLVLVAGSTASGAGTFDWSGGSLQIMNTASPSSVFVIASSGSYELEQIINISFANVPGNQTITVDLPDTSSVNSVPEPASVALLCSSLGAICLATAWRQRKRSV